MADKSSKTNGNVAGKYYVDSSCTGCQVCVDTAPDNFKMADDDMAYVFKQPSSPAEEKACQESKDGCPSEAIGDDGP